MNDIRQLLRRAFLRMLGGRVISAWVIALAAAAGLLCVLLFTQRLLAFEIDWRLTWLSAIAASVGAAIAWALIRRPDTAEVARAVDERAALRETLSTALCVERQSDPWSVATVNKAAEASKRVIVRQAFPVTSPRFWKAPLLAIAVFALLALAMPQWDVLGALAEREEKQAKQEELMKTVSFVDSEQEELRKLLEQTGDQELEDELADPEGAPEPQSPEEVKRRAIKKLTSVKDRLEEMRQSAEGQRHDALKQKMSMLRQPGPGPLNDVISELQKGNFAGAMAQLEELQKKIANGELSEEQTKQLAEQMQQMAEQLQKLAEDRAALADKLESLGLDGALASDPDALQKALDQMDGLTNEQKQAIMEMAQGMQKACENLGEMGQMMAQCAGGAGDGQGMGELGEMLGEMEMLEGEMAACDAGLGKCRGALSQLGQGLGASQSIFTIPRKGQGQGNRGQANGAPGSVEEADYNTTKEKAIGKTQAGPIIGERLVQEGQVVGESRAEYVDVVRAGDEAAREAIDDNVIPREYHDSVKRYFGRLQSKVEAEKASTGGASTDGDTPQEKE